MVVLILNKRSTYSGSPRANGPYSYTRPRPNIAYSNMELAAVCVDSRRKQRHVLQTLERIRWRFLQAGMCAGVVKLAVGWRVGAALSADLNRTMCQIFSGAVKSSDF